MISKIPEETKKKIINGYVNTMRPIKSLAKENGLLMEEVISVLQEYQDTQLESIARNKKEILKKKEITDEEIYEQREKNLTYTAIAEYFTSQGRITHATTISKRCKKIYQKKDKEEPKIKHKSKYKGKKKIQISNEEIYELREKRLTYKAIAEYFSNQGRQISTSTIQMRCKEIYEKKGKKEPKAEKKKYSQITNEEIYEQRQKGLTYRAIAEYFTNQGKKISRQRIEQRYKKMCKTMDEKSEDIDSGKTVVNEENLREQILKLKETKGATDEQITKIAKIYGIDLVVSNKENEER